MQDTDVVLNYVNPSVHGIEQGEARHRSIRGLNLAEVRPTTLSEWLNKLGHNLLHTPLLRKILYIFFIKVTKHSVVTKEPQSP
jgi:hypothetical protein